MTDSLVKQEEEEEQPSALQDEMARSMLKLLLASFLEMAQGQLRARPVEEREAAIRLFYLAKHYFTEMSSCFKSDTKLAATVMACSGLEALLMLTGICYQREVIGTKAWKNNKKAKKKGRTYFRALLHSDLGCLVAVSEELGWFSAEMPTYFRENEDIPELVSLLASVPSGEVPSKVAASLAKDARNRLHPGLCIRDNHDLDDSQSLMLGIGFVTLALCSFFAQQSHGVTKEMVQNLKSAYDALQIRQASANTIA